MKRLYVAQAHLTVWIELRTTISTLENLVRLRDITILRQEQQIAVLRAALEHHCEDF
jgi:hypothetical protein